jgi:uncharacterized protein YeaO (DUF488 family)
MIKLKRAYDQAVKSDGFRILVDRLWPRGISKERAALDIWMKDIAPSTELRTWFGHDPAKWSEFKKRYKAELKKNSELTNFIHKKAAHAIVTLVYGAKDQEHNEAIVLKDFIEHL